VPVHGPWALALTVILSTPVVAAGHAFLERSEPRAQSTVKAAPAGVRLWFTERIEPAYSWVHVVDPNGRRVDENDATVADPNPRMMGVSLRPLGEGIYKVVWRVLSVDAHITEGEFAFRVGP
jgi:copper resistance protein C